MTLTMLETGSSQYIKHVTGKDDIRRYLANLGFVEGENITVVSQMGGNLILSIKNTRIALDKTMANRIIV